MNHEGDRSLSAAAAGPSSSRPVNSDEHGEQRRREARAAAALKKKQKNNRKMFNRKRGDLLDNLIHDIDLLVYAELSMIYYLDCSFLRFALRASAQFMYNTPKPSVFSRPPFTTQPVLLGILSTNAICLIIHFLFAPPSAGETTRGYLHGGLAMDFIGQTGTSRWRLLLLDMLVLVLQLVCMSACMVRSRLKELSKSSSDQTASAAVSTATTQDLDAEERGVVRADDEQDIEMQNLNPSASDTLLDSTPPMSTDAHIFDAFYSGQIVVADLDLWKKIKEQVALTKEHSSNENGPAASGVEMLRNGLQQRMERMRRTTDAIRGSM